MTQFIQDVASGHPASDWVTVLAGALIPLVAAGLMTLATSERT